MRAKWMLLSCLLLMSCLSLCNNVWAKTPTGQPMAYLNSFQGDVKIIRTGVVQATVQTGDLLYLGDEIQCGESAKAEIYVSEAGLLHLAANSTLQITQALQQKRQVQILRLLRGGLRGVFEKLKTPLQLETPSAVAGIRGTRLILTMSSIALLEGEIEVSSAKRRTNGIRLYSGEEVLTQRQALQSQPMSLLQMQGLERPYEFGIVTHQTPYLLTHQQWAALVVRSLEYYLPRGWENYPAQTYLDLLSAVDGNEQSVENYMDGDGKATVGIDRSGNSSLVATQSPFTVSYELPLAVTGEYVLLSDVAGGSQYYSWEGQETQLSPAQLGTNEVTLAPVNMRRGVQRLRITVPVGGKLGSFKLKGPAFAGYTPTHGYSKDRILRYHDMAECIGKILELDADVMQNQERLFSTLKGKGFFLGAPQAPATGVDGIANAAILRGEKSNLETAKPKSKRKLQVRPLIERSAVSPVTPPVTP